MVVLKPELQPCAYAHLAGQFHAPAAVLGIHLNQRQPQPHLARGARSGVGVGHPRQKFGRHPLSIVLYHEVEIVVFDAVADSKPDF